MLSGDMEMKQNKSLPPEQQIVTANPDIVTVCGTFTFFLIFNLKLYFTVSSQFCDRQ